MLRCRKNQSTLTPDEKARFVAAVLALKANGKYDTYVAQHNASHLAAHRGPAFLPWHREFLRRFELDLQAIDPTVTLPYWDWTVDNSPLSSLWGPDFMGGNGRPSDGRVMTGPFAFAGGNWTLSLDGPDLKRMMGVSVPTLPTAMDVTAALGQTVYDVAPWSPASASGFRNTLEGWIAGPQLHNRVHVWVGGSMAPLTSPNDPVFFLHHCFVDKLWADWQRAHPGVGYLPVSGGPAGHNLNDAMEPWKSNGETVTPAGLLDHHVLGYAYDNEPECRPTLKFLDDGPTRKFLDDEPTLKFRDDLPPTLKFRDDEPTLKFRDDGPTLKFNDDVPTRKFADDEPTLKFRDDNPPTLKARDDEPTLKERDDEPTLKNLDDAPTQKFIDDGPTQKFLDDGQQVGGAGSLPRPESRAAPARAASAPFVLATPHHSMAWTRTFPDAFRAELGRMEQALEQYQALLRQMVDAAGRGELGRAEQEELEALDQEYAALLEQYQALLAERGRR